LANVSNVAIHAIEEDKYMAIRLKGKLANLYHDLPPTALKTTSTFKLLCDGNPVEVNAKYSVPMAFVNYAKFVFSCNELPKFENPTDADFDRWQLFLFPRRFEGKDADRDLTAKITTPEELSGILNWALEGLKRLRAINQFTGTTTTDAMREKYTLLSDPLRAFLMKECNFDDSTALLPKEAFYSAFLIYASKNKFNTPTERKFWLEVPKKLSDVSGKYAPEGWYSRPGTTERQNCVKGVRLITNIELPKEVTSDTSRWQDLSKSKDFQAQIEREDITSGKSGIHPIIFSTMSEKIHNETMSENTLTSLTEKVMTLTDVKQKILLTAKSDSGLTREKIVGLYELASMEDVQDLVNELMANGKLKKDACGILRHGG
jgi:putative DNA primase/helicase